jgi:hypothetical protein
MRPPIRSSMMIAAPTNCPLPCVGGGGGGVVDGGMMKRGVPRRDYIVALVPPDQLSVLLNPHETT